MKLSEATADPSTMPAGYPPQGEVIRILGAAADVLSSHTGRTYSLGVDAELRVLTAIRDDGYHAAFSLAPGPDAPRFVRAAGERIGREDPSPEERAKMWFRYRVDAAVEAFVNCHNQQAGRLPSKDANLPQVWSAHG